MLPKQNTSLGLDLDTPLASISNSYVTYTTESYPIIVPVVDNPIPVLPNKTITQVFTPETSPQVSSGINNSDLIFQQSASMQKAKDLEAKQLAIEQAVSKAKADADAITKASTVVEQPHNKNPNNTVIVSNNIIPANDLSTFNNKKSNYIPYYIGGAILLVSLLSFLIIKK